MVDPQRLERNFAAVRDALLAERNADGYWTGELSSSALSTATAIFALALVDSRTESNRRRELIEQGVAWLIRNQNGDGGWGDTDRSISNISTTMLCRAALHFCDSKNRSADAIKSCENWLKERYGSSPPEWAEAVRKRYGRDRTFAVPILTMSALAGLTNWREVPRLPFELACLPQSWYRFARLPVVSYALPALIAIGQVVHQKRSTWNPITRILRRMARTQSLKVLRRIQPSSGGYLEATPLTSFVVMSLAALPENIHASEVMNAGVTFLVDSMRPDGSWPIDSNLSVWVTTLTVNALAAAGELESLPDKDKLIDWLLAQQGKTRHPFTGADPGAWGWSHLPGSVPDCDDTPGAILALDNLQLYLIFELPFDEERLERSIERGERWVRDLQNSDSGWPTFCKGWGKLPFDRSGCDLTAHALRALFSIRSLKTISDLEPCLKGFSYLAAQQRADGSWLPLWFGNQYAPDEINPVYGTVRVLAAYVEWDRLKEKAYKRGIEFLLKNQNADGGWGGLLGTPSSMEETSLVVELFCGLFTPELRESLIKGLEFLCLKIEEEEYKRPTPIGFYFAKLWYYEKLYPLIFATAALGKMIKLYEGGAVISTGA